jgi:hypothetical protein
VCLEAPVLNYNLILLSCLYKIRNNIVFPTTVRSHYSVYQYTVDYTTLEHVSVINCSKVVRITWLTSWYFRRSLQLLRLMSLWRCVKRSAFAWQKCKSETEAKLVFIVIKRRVTNSHELGLSSLRTRQRRTVHAGKPEKHVAGECRPQIEWVCESNDYNMGQ